MIAELQVYPENAFELTEKRATPCCDRPDVLIDRAGGMLTMSCLVCGALVRTKMTESQLRSGNPLKNRRALLKAMAADVEALIERWNLKIITGFDEYPKANG